MSVLSLCAYTVYRKFHVAINVAVEQTDSSPAMASYMDELLPRSPLDWCWAGRWVRHTQTLMGEKHQNEVSAAGSLIKAVRFNTDLMS